MTPEHPSDSTESAEASRLTYHVEDSQGQVSVAYLEPGGEKQRAKSRQQGPLQEHMTQCLQPINGRKRQTHRAGWGQGSDLQRFYGLRGHINQPQCIHLTWTLIRINSTCVFFFKSWLSLFLFTWSQFLSLYLLYRRIILIAFLILIHISI